MSPVRRLRVTDCIFFGNVNLRPGIRGLVKRPEDWRWSSYNNFALDKATVTVCPIQIDDVRLPLGYRA